MKKNTVINLLIFTILFGVSSCATDPLLRSYIVGTWLPAKLSSVEINKIVPGKDSIPQQLTEEDVKILLALKYSLSKPASKGNLKNVTGSAAYSLVMDEANTLYLFTPDGVGARMYPGQLLRGPWKLKKKGAKLVLTDEKTKEKFILLIDSLSSDRMVATNENLPDGIKITYNKAK